MSPTPVRSMPTAPGCWSSSRSSTTARTRRPWCCTRPKARSCPRPTSRTSQQGFTDATGSREPLQVSKDRTAAIGVTTVEGTGSEAVSEGVAELRADVARDLPDGVSAQVTGPAAIEADLSAVFDGADTRLLLVTASVVAVLLILTYRSPILWIVPLAVVGVADRLAAVLATQTLAAVGIPWDESTVGILSVLVFGAGTDYALLLISRYRDELRLHEDRYVAMRRARGVPPRRCCPAPRPWWSAYSRCCCARSRPRGVSAWPVPSASWWRLPASCWCCRRRWCSSAAGCSGRVVPRVGQRTLADSGSFWGRVGRSSPRAPGRLIVGSTLLLAVMAAGLTPGADRPVHLRAVPRRAGGDRGGRSAGRELPGRRLRAHGRRHRRGDPTRRRPRPSGGVAGVDAGRPTEGDDGWSRLTVVLEPQPGQRRRGTDRARPAFRARRVRARPTSAARRRRRSTRPTPRPRSRLVIPLVLGAGAARAGGCSCGRWWRR